MLPPALGRLWLCWEREESDSRDAAMRDKLEQEQAFLASLIADRAASSKTAAGRAGAGRAADARGSKTKEAAGDGVDGGAPPTFFT